MSDDLVYPIKTWRAIHSVYLEAVMFAKDGTRDWLLSLTQGALDFEHVVLAFHKGEHLQLRYIVEDNEQDGWFLLYGRHETGEWLRLGGINIEDAGLTVEWLRLSEQIIVENALDALVGGDQ